jgi:hypothetical protein
MNRWIWHEYLKGFPELMDPDRLPEMETPRAQMSTLEDFSTLKLKIGLERALEQIGRVYTVLIRGDCTKPLNEESWENWCAGLDFVGMVSLILSRRGVTLGLKTSHTDYNDRNRGEP